MKPSLLAVLMLVACGGAPHGMVVGHKDLGNGNPVDMAVPTGDFATLPLNQRTWDDESSPRNDAGQLLVPDGGELSGVWNNDSTAVAVGDYGSVLRKDRGNTWVADTSSKPSGVALIGTGGRGTTDAYALGIGGALWKYSGAEWSGSWMPDAPPTNDNFRSIWVAPDGMAFAEGDTSVIMRIMNSSYNWVTLNGAPASDEYPDWIWGFMTGTNTYSVYVLGCQFNASTMKCQTGRIWHATIVLTPPSMLSGATLMPQTVSASDCQLAYGMWAASTTDLYVVCDGGRILHSTGDGNWVQQHSGLLSGDLYSISGASADEIYAVGDVDGSGVPIVLHKYDHSIDTWTRDTVPSTVKDPLYSVFATPYDVYAVGGHGSILHK